MEIEKRLAELIDGGCCIGGGEPGIVVCVAVIRLVPGGLWWCGSWLQDQHHVHYLPYDNYKDNGYGIAFYQNGNYQAYIAPYEDWPGAIDPDAFLEQWSRWKTLLSDPDQQEALNRFIDDSTGMSPS